ncbi:Undecaprenyl-diphosphatase [hydrothermal vent metagenome]|uniref:Undecaprenyl-diphosphatase n=1 Tax=hydrothermal vent metagenome TaxID=652676 RepID=A0A3B1CWU6_9ZZZZ
MESIGALQAFVLGCVQGLTEYLPISSSGHLVIAQNLFGIKEPELFFDIVLHLGTLIAIIGYYRADVLGAIKDSVAGLTALLKGAGWNDVNQSYPGLRLAFLIIIGSIPTGVIGIGFKDQFLLLFGDVKTVGFMLIITGLFLFLTRFAPSSGREIARMRWWEAALIGVAQGLAITPGISRSGATICLALFMGIGREAAARYSFLLSLPAISGALILNMEPPETVLPMSTLALGFFSSLIVGYLCLALLVILLKKGKFHLFSIYCFIVGAGTIVYFL